MQKHCAFSWVLVMAASAACGWGDAAPVEVRPGIDVLLADSLHLVAGARVGLLTNQTGIDARGVEDLARLRDAAVDVVALFTPEHGFRGARDDENIGHAVDSATGLPIYSLYGATRRPTDAMLDAIDVLIVDLQDIGGRTYTYVSTALLALQAAAARNVRVVVLDRPNPIGGLAVQGPMLDTPFASFVGMLAVPLRHGMTLGELVRLGDDVLEIGGRPEVVPVAGWRRAAWFDETGLPWIRPSPSMPSLESAAHYTALVWFEATDLSVGRGTPVAFSVLAAPWLDARALARRLAGVPGVTVRDTTIRPQAPPDGKFDGHLLPALRFEVTDRSAYDPPALGVRLLVAVRDQHPGRLGIQEARFDRLAGSDRLRRAIEAGVGADSIIGSWERAVAAFRMRRRKYLIY